MARRRTRRMFQARRTIATLVALAACLLQGLVAFGSLKAQAWSLDDSIRGVVVLVMLVFILFAMLMAAVAMLVSPETAAYAGMVAVGLALGVVFVAAPGTASELFSQSLTDAAFFLAAPITVLGLGALLTNVEGGHLF